MTPIDELLDTSTLVPLAARPPPGAPDSHFDKTTKPQVKLLSRESAKDERFIAELASLVNRVYHEAHGSIFGFDFQRTNVSEIQEFIQAGEIAAAFLPCGNDSGTSQGPTDEVVPVGVIRMQKLSATRGEFGMLALDANHRGGGLGTDMVTFAEEHCRSMGMQTMQTEALSPSYSDYAFKHRLQSWYQRMGYQFVRVDDYATHYPQLAKKLRGPAEYLVFEKVLI